LSGQRYSRFHLDPTRNAKPTVLSKARRGQDIKHHIWGYPCGNHIILPHSCKKRKIFEWRGGRRRENHGSRIKFRERACPIQGQKLGEYLKGHPASGESPRPGPLLGRLMCRRYYVKICQVLVLLALLSSQARDFTVFAYCRQTRAGKDTSNCSPICNFQVAECNWPDWLGQSSYGPKMAFQRSP